MSNNGSNTLTRGLSVLGKLFAGSRKGPSGERVRRLKKLQKRIGVRFTDLSLLEQALTHRSYSHVTAQTRNDSNERMEFLGDSVLGLSVSQFLYLEFPDRSEGALSKMKSLLVSRKVLSTVSRNVGLGEYLLLSGEESDMGGRDRTSILADSFEGLIGAVYLDQGYRSANLFIRRTLLSDIDEILKDEEHTNYKSLLQEHVQSRRLSHPVYRVRREEGPEHEKEFAVDVIVRGEPWGSGRGKSKKDAEQNAARAALEHRQEKPARPARGGDAPRRRGRRPEGRAAEERPGRPAPPEVAEAPSSRPRGDHGIVASRERIRTERSDEGEGRRRDGEPRQRRVSERPPRERIAREPREERGPREPREPREPRPVRERVPRPQPEAAEPGEVRSSGEEPARRRRRRRGSRGGAGRSSESGAVVGASADASAGMPVAPPDAPVEAVRKADRPGDIEREAPSEPSWEAESAAPVEPAPPVERVPDPAPDREPGGEDRWERPSRGESPAAEADPPYGRGSHGRSRRRPPRPEPVARRDSEPPREPLPPRDLPAPAEPSAAEESELTAAGGGDDGFARRRKRVVRGLRKR
jgi:ribonuclease-3